MRISDECLQKIKEFEGLRLTAYQCSAGKWTIGYGHTKGVRPGDRISQYQANDFLREDVTHFENWVNGQSLRLKQGQFDALVDFAFNLGTAALGSSTLLKKIRAGADTAEIQAQFMRWVYVGKKVLPGLVTRRTWEAEMWAK